MENPTLLFDSYSIAEISYDRFQPFFKEHWQSIFQDLLSFEIDDLLSEQEKDSRNHLNARLGNPLCLYYGIFHQSSLIGWSFGRQETSERFYMVSTAIFPEHRNQGVYGKLLPILLDRIKKEGFQIAYSRHRATHNAVIIPKLKNGFQITNLEISEKYGVLVHLSYYFNKARREVLELRSGKRLSEDKMKSLFLSSQS